MKHSNHNVANNLIAAVYTIAVVSFCAPSACAGEAPPVLQGTAPLKTDAYMPALIGKQWDRFLLREIERVRAQRNSLWDRDDSSRAAYVESLGANKDRFRRYIGAIDRRTAAINLELVARLGESAQRATSAKYDVLSVRWPVFEGVHGEGLLLKPKTAPTACVVIIPDSDQIPEMLAGINPGVHSQSQLGRQLARNGIMALIPTLIDRRSMWSGNNRVSTDQPHREWIYRQSQDVGRHPIGYEVQKVQAALDWFCLHDQAVNLPPTKKGVVGYGEGGLIAFYTAALDDRVDAAWVSGYFQPREGLWREPVYRNIWALLTEFGDAEIASMIAPRRLIVEYSRHPVVSHPSPARQTENGVRRIAAPGRIATPSLAAVTSEFQRAQRLAGRFGNNFTLIRNTTVPVRFGSAPAREAFLDALEVNDTEDRGETWREQRPLSPDEIDARQHRQIRELQDFTKKKVQLAEVERDGFFWNKLKRENANQWRESIQPFREYFWNEVIGKFPDTTAPLNARTRLAKQHSEAQITTYEVVLDVRPDLVTWGYLMLPNDLQPDERRPVVVCQHGAGGDASITLQPGRPYEEYAKQLARRGFVVYTPYNPNRLLGEDFRQLQRKANPLKKSVFGIFAANHQRTLQWLKQLPFVDGKRIAFYGLSYGGKTAVRVPAVLDDYCLSICSGDWNDYLRKVTSLDSALISMMFYDSYENVQFNLGNTFNYAEMAALIAPRPFMVEHGYKDKVAPLKWAAAEYSKVQELYFHLGIPERTEMEFFDGPHTIHGKGTFDFLHRHLNWPKPKE